MIYSAACAYAIRAMCRLALMESNGYVTVQQLCAGTDLPAQFIAKVFRDLVRGGLLTSAKGPGGGFALARPMEHIRLYDIVEAVDGVDHLHQCVVGLARCDSEQPCPQHETFAPLRQQIVDYLGQTTLSEISEALARKLELTASPTPRLPDPAERRRPPARDRSQRRRS